MQIGKPKPFGLVVIYNPGFKFKYKKYYIKQGTNTIGSTPDNTIQIQDDSSISNKAAIITCTDNLITLQPLTQGSVYVLSNVKGKNNLMVPLLQGVQYVVEMEKDFIICGRKALMQVSDLSELLQVRGVENQAGFDLEKENNYVGGGGGQNVFLPSLVQATLPIGNTYNFEPTVPLEDQYFQATQRLDDDIGVFEPTLPLDFANTYPQQQKQSKMTQSFRRLMQPSQAHEIIPSSLLKSVHSSILASSSNQKQEKNQEQAELEMDMPQTIKQDSMPATIKQGQAQPQYQQFPPTIQDHDDKIKHVESDKEKDIRMMEEIRKKTSTLIKSEPALRQAGISKSSIKVSNFHSLEEKPAVSIDSFDDLFGGNQMNQSGKTVMLKSAHSKEEKSNSKCEIKMTHSENGSEKTEKMQSDPQVQAQTNKIKNKKSLIKINQVAAQQEQSQKQLSRKCYAIPKLSKIDSEKLKKQRNYDLISSTDMEHTDFQLLLVENQLKISKILLVSLIKGREIKPVSWISNPAAKIGGKLEGFLWEHIDKRKGKGTSIFNKSRQFYLQKELRDQFSQVLIEAGANLVPELTRTMSKTKVLIIIDEKSEAGKVLFEEKKNYKNWSFYGKKMIIESVLMGQEIIEKYELSSYSF